MNKSLTSAGLERDLTLAAIIFRCSLASFLHVLITEVPSCRPVQLIPTDWTSSYVDISTVDPSRLLFNRKVKAKRLRLYHFQESHTLESQCIILQG